MERSILRNVKQWNKFCSKLNKWIGCRDAHMCSVICPAWVLYQSQALMDHKNYTLGEAMRQTFTESIDKRKARKIIDEMIESLVKGKKEYPPEGWEKRFEKDKE